MRRTIFFALAEALAVLARALLKLADAATSAATRLRDYGRAR
jgi:hypothetical protein